MCSSTVSCLPHQSDYVPVPWRPPARTYTLPLGVRASDRMGIWDGGPGVYKVEGRESHKKSRMIASIRLQRRRSETTTPTCETDKPCEASHLGPASGASRAGRNRTQGTPYVHQAPTSSPPNTPNFHLIDDLPRSPAGTVHRLWLFVFHWCFPPSTSAHSIV